MMHTNKKLISTHCNLAMLCLWSLMTRSTLTDCRHLILQACSALEIITIANIQLKQIHAAMKARKPCVWKANNCWGKMHASNTYSTHLNIFTYLQLIHLRANPFIIRPLLLIRKGNIYTYCTKNKKVTHPSNKISYRRLQKCN